MRDRISIPVKVVNGTKWGDLSVFAPHHQLCAEKMQMMNEKYSFAGGHRVRLIKLTKNVHWQIPSGVEVDITDVAPAGAPPRRQGQHSK